MTKHPTTMAILALAAFISATASAKAQSQFAQHGEVVLAIGDPVPTAIPGVTPVTGTIAGLDSPSLDQNGTIVFRAQVAGSGVATTDNRAYFMGRTKNDLQMILRSGDPAPGLPGFTMRTATLQGLSNPLRISPFNEFLFFQTPLYDTTTSSNPPATADTALFWGPVGAFLCLAREGDPVPVSMSTTGETWGPFIGGSELQYKHINASGQVAFMGQLLGGAATTANDAIIVSGGPGNLSIVCREGDSFGGAVVVPASGQQMSFTLQINEAGQVMHAINFSTTLGSPPATTSNDRALAIWTPGGGPSTIIAREGDPAPGLPVGTIFATGWSVNQGSASFTRSGKTAITSPISGPSITAGVNDNAIHFGGVGGMNLVMQKGDPVPGLPGVTFGVVNNGSLGCNDAGEVVFFCSLVGTGVTTANDSAMFFGTAGNLQMLAREGDPVPGMTGYTFQGITSNPLLRDGGGVLMNLAVTDGTLFPTVLLGYTPQTGTRIMIDQTESVTTTLGTGTISTLSSNAGFGGGDGGQSMFNNQGDFTYRPNLTGAPSACIIRSHLGSFLAKPSAVPVAGGVPQNFVIDAGPANANSLYLVLASGLGTRPGFGSPLGPQNIPLNFDPLWTLLTINAANSPIWINSLGFTDATGKGLGAASFVMPAGYPSFLGATIHHAALIIDGTLTSTFATEPSALKFY